MMCTVPRVLLIKAINTLQCLLTSHFLAHTWISLLALPLVAQECKFILNYLYQKSRGEGHLNLDTFLAAVRAFSLGEQEEAADRELQKWKVSLLSMGVLLLLRGVCMARNRSWSSSVRISSPH